jgi:hypothetical protein
MRLREALFPKRLRANPALIGSLESRAVSEGKPSFHFERCDFSFSLVAHSHDGPGLANYICDSINTSKVTKMPRSTSSLRFDTARAGFPADDGDARKPVHEKEVQFEPNDDHPNSMRRPGEGPPLEELLRWLARSLAVLAVLGSFALLCVGATPLLTFLPTYLAKVTFRGGVLVRNLPLSALPLLLAGSSYVVLQAILRPRPLELVKRLMLGIAFLLWGVVQLMPVSDLAAELGNVVIALYVVDLGLIIWTDLQKNQPRFVR